MSGPTPLTAVDLTPEAFAPFGEVIRPTADGTPYGPPHDAALALPVAGTADPTNPLSTTPRLYIMTLPARAPRPLGFDRLTFHARASQCLASLDAAWAPWFLAVAAPSGSVDRFPRADAITAFRIPPGVFVKLHPGTWHAGPLFDPGACVRRGGEGEVGGGGVPCMAFANLEMADTNVTDHNTHVYGGEGFVVVAADGSAGEGGGGV